MTETILFTRDQIAPCGLNCATCRAYLRSKNKCLGCRVDSDSKNKSCLQCKIKNCERLKYTESKFCFECDLFPCDLMKHIDFRYRTKYRTSLIQNLLSIKENGIDFFLKEEGEKWTCPNCGSTLSVHKRSCSNCNIESDRL